MTSLAGKIALIVGGTSGIGAASAKALAEAGAVVVVAARGLTPEDSSVKAAVDDDRIEFFKTDISSESDTIRLFDRIASKHGRLDLALNSAGYEGEFQTIQECATDDFDRVLDVNLRGLFLGLRQEVASMLTTGGGSIVNVASVAGIKGIPRSSAYSAAKHAVVGLTRSVALEVAGRGIRVNALCPGLVDTPMADRLASGIGVEKQAMANANPMQRLVTPKELAGAVLWLFSEAAASITGQALSIDGGLSIA